MTRALLVEGSAQLALDGSEVGTLRGSGAGLTLDVADLRSALRLARASGGSSERRSRLTRLSELTGATGLQFGMSVRGRMIARVEPAPRRPLRLHPLAILRSLIPG